MISARNPADAGRPRKRGDRAARGRVAARKRGNTGRSEPLDSVQSELRNVPWIGLEFTSLDALDDASQHIVGAAR